MCEEFRNSESVFTVGVVGIPTKSKFPDDSQGQLEKQAFQSSAAWLTMLTLFYTPTKCERARSPGKDKSVREGVMGREEGQEISLSEFLPYDSTIDLLPPQTGCL